MIDRKLADYVKRYINSGYDKDQLRQTLINSGWSPDQVDDAIDHALSKHPLPYPHGEMPKGPSMASTAPGKKMGIIERFRTVLFHPGAFFDAVKTEQGYETPVRFYLFITLIAVVMLNLITVAAVSLSPIESGMGLGLGAAIALIFSNLIFMNVTIILVIGATFLSAGLLHIFIRLFGGKGGYQNTYKLAVYSAAPVAFLLLSLPALLISPYIVIAVGLIASVWAFIIQLTGLSRLHGMTWGRIALMIITMIVVTLLVAFIITAVMVSIMLGSFNLATYKGRIPTGFTTLGAPDDWYLDSNGDFNIMLNNMLAKQITVYSITATKGTATDTWDTYNCWGDNDYMTIGPGENSDFSTTCPYADQPYKLNLGPQDPGTTYSVDVEIEYSSEGVLKYTEFGSVSGTVY